MFGHQQPQPQQVAGNLIGQELSDLALQAGGVGELVPLSFSAALSGQQERRVLGVEGVEFFFAGRSRRSLVGHCAC